MGHDRCQLRPGVSAGIECCLCSPHKAVCSWGSPLPSLSLSSSFENVGD